MISFNFLGIPVRIAPWFWITMVFIGGGMTAQTKQDLLYVFLFVFAGFISIFVHELGHALTVRKFGLPVGIALVAFGGMASFPAGKLDRKQTSPLPPGQRGGETASSSAAGSSSSDGGGSSSSSADAGSGDS